MYTSFLFYKIKISDYIDERITMIIPSIFYHLLSLREDKKEDEREDQTTDWFHLKRK